MFSVSNSAKVYLLYSHNPNIYQTFVRGKNKKMMFERSEVYLSQPRHTVVVRRINFVGNSELVREFGTSNSSLVERSPSGASNSGCLVELPFPNCFVG